MCLRHQLDTYKGIVALKEGAGLRKLVELVCAVLDVTISRNQKSTSARRRVLHNLARFWLHQTDHTIDQRAWCEVLPCTRLLLRGILFEQSFVKVSQALFARGEPVEGIDGSHQGL